MSLPPCSYGASCYRKNPSHLAAFSHPVSLTPCKYGKNCYNTSSNHRLQFSHEMNSTHDSESDSDSDSINPNNKRKNSSESDNKKEGLTTGQRSFEENNSESESEEKIPILGKRKKSPIGESERPPVKKQKTEEISKRKGKWLHHKSIHYYISPNSHESTKIAAFDMDSTLIVPASGKVHPKGRNDWKWFANSVPKKLKKLHDAQFQIVIFSNQKGISTEKTPASAIQGKIEDLEKDCGIPFCAVLSTKDDEFRKPSPKAWEFFCSTMTSKVIDMKNSFYVGDAAGRPVDWAPGKKKDFGCSDRKFAMNAGLPFYTPEEYFFKEEPASFDWRGVNPKIIKEYGELPFDSDKLISNSQEVILFVGFPASGKSTFAKTYLEPRGYVRVNRDTLHTASKCLKFTKESLENGKSVVIDNTNPSVKARQPYIAAAKQAGVPIRCFHFLTSEEVSKHLNSFREVFSKGEQKHVPTVGYNMFKKHFVEPHKTEGFSEVIAFPFKRFHPDRNHKILFEQWTEVK